MEPEAVEQSAKPIEDGELLATAKVSAMENVHLPRAVAKELRVEIGDTLAFVRVGSEIAIRKAQIRVVYED